MAKTLSLLRVCVSTAFLAKTLPLPCASVAEPAPFPRPSADLLAVAAGLVGETGLSARLLGLHAAAGGLSGLVLRSAGDWGHYN